ncbi:hypothetical protein F4678DRAFT_479928 [Xylaria arbuscula]|nr:hypothetical protein F4678DRAFT_479928 [Xylaria arbuscula]
MADLLPLGDDITISSSLDPIYTGESAPLGDTIGEISKILRRVKSVGHQSRSQDCRYPLAPDERGGQHEQARARTGSPVRANSKRRRAIRRVPLTLSFSQFCSELDSHARDNLPHGLYYPPIQLAPIPGQRSLSRGRRWRRDDTPHPSSSARDKDRPRERSNASRGRRHTRSERTLGQEGYSLPSSEATDVVLDTSSYIVKGGFRLHNRQQAREFKFPQSKTQSEPAWYAGDGFSGDEASPQSAFSMAHKAKRRRSRSLSAFGQLSLETQSSVDRNLEGVASSQPYLRGSHRLRGQASETMREVWPTRENFMDSSLDKKPRNVVNEDYSMAEVMSPLNPQTPPSSRPEMRPGMSRKRRASDFENFGKRRRRSASRQSKESPMLYAGGSPVLGSLFGDEEDEEDEEERNEFYEGEYMSASPILGTQLSDNEDEDERTQLYEGVSDESVQQSEANEEPDYILATANDVGTSDFDTEMRDEEDAEDSSDSNE